MKYGRYSQDEKCHVALIAGTGAGLCSLLDSCMHLNEFENFSTSTLYGSMDQRSLVDEPSYQCHHGPHFTHYLSGSVLRQVSAWSQCVVHAQWQELARDSLHDHHVAEELRHLLAAGASGGAEGLLHRLPPLCSEYTQHGQWEAQSIHALCFDNNHDALHRQRLHSLTAVLLQRLSGSGLTDSRQSMTQEVQGVSKQQAPQFLTLWSH